LITQKEFFDKALDDRIQTLYEEGIFIVSIRYYAYKINLYLISNFYVEVFYNHKLDKIERIELLKKNDTRMKFYADQINLPSNLFDYRNK
jgi:hypothetical protein